MTPSLGTQLTKTAQKSPCRYQVAAAALDKKGRVVAMGFNKPRLFKKGGGIHAEIDALRKSSPQISMLVLYRVGRSGHALPIHPCPACYRLLSKLGIHWRLHGPERLA